MAVLVSSTSSSNNNNDQSFDTMSVQLGCCCVPLAAAAGGRSGILVKDVASAEIISHHFGVDHLRLLGLVCTDFHIRSVLPHPPLNLIPSSTCVFLVPLHCVQDKEIKSLSSSSPLLLLSYRLALPAAIFHPVQHLGLLRQLASSPISRPLNSTGTGLI